MSYIEAVISGVVQGLTEFLPVSSSGHLVILHHYLGYKEPQVLFDVFLHLGTVFSVLVYFWYDIIKMIKRERRLLALIIVGSVPTALIGFLFKDIFENLFADIKTVGLMLSVTATFLFIGESVAKREAKLKAYPAGLGWVKALIIGIVQGISIIPGISRSGSTIATALMLKLEKQDAVRFSFLLSIPAVCGAVALKLADAKAITAISPYMIIGTITAFFVGLIAIYFLKKAVDAYRLKFFAVYCILVGGAVLIL